MFFNVFLTFLLLPFSSLLATEKSNCEIALAPRILLSQSATSDLRLKSVASFNDCQEAHLKALGNILASAQGRVSSQILSSQINNILYQKNVETSSVHISPEIIEIISLEDALHASLSLANDRKFFDLSFVGTDNIFPLGPDDQIKAECAQCDRLGLKSLSFRLSSQDKHPSQEQVFWIQATLKQRVHGYTAKKNLHVTRTPMASSDFVKSTTYSLRPESVLTDLSKIHFYQLNRAINKNDLLTKDFLSPARLVRQGSQVEISLVRDGLNITRTAIAMNSGHYGDSIRLRQENSSRTLNGTIVGNNKVIIK